MNIRLMTYIGNRLKQTRLERGISKSRIAQAVGVTTFTISKWESKKTREEIPTESIFKISMFLEINPYWLATGLGTPGASYSFPDIGAKTESLAYSIDQLTEPERDFVLRIIRVMSFGKSKRTPVKRHTGEAVTLLPVDPRRK